VNPSINNPEELKFCPFLYRVLHGADQNVSVKDIGTLHARFIDYRIQAELEPIACRSAAKPRHLLYVWLNCRQSRYDELLARLFTRD
jgi:hypothetical protein